MTITFDAQTEQRIQREIDLGHFREPADVIAHALSLLEAEEDWLLANKDAINERLEHSMAQAARGEVYTAEEVARFLDQSILQRDQRTASS